MPAVSNRQFLANLQPDPRGRRGSFIVRAILAPMRVRQSRHALVAAGTIAVALPVIQALLLVAVLDAEWWQGLLGLEGLVISLLARAQFRRASMESKLLGYGISLVNAAALGAIGMALGGHLFWVTGLVGMAAITWLTFSVTGAKTVRRVVAGFLLATLLLAGACGLARYGLVASAAQPDPAVRATLLDAAWAGLQLRGGNGTERALLRLRQAQAAFEGGRYQRAFELAHDGAFDSNGSSRVPASAIGQGLLDSLLRIKSQAYYNARWEKAEQIWMPIKNDPLPPEFLAEESVRAKWGW